MDNVNLNMEDTIIGSDLFLSSGGLIPLDPIFSDGSSPLPVSSLPPCTSTETSVAAVTSVISAGTCTNQNFGSGCTQGNKVPVLSTVTSTVQSS